jgi:hypothetical protein
MRVDALRCLACLVLMLSIAFPHARAAEIIATSGACDLLIRGEIEQGDTDRLGQAYEKTLNDKSRDFVRRVMGEAERDFSLCLNSPGGSYDEAIRLSQWLIEKKGVNTVVDRNAECYSACALVFMFGGHNDGDRLERPSRRMHVTAKIGFHSPYINPAVDAQQVQLSARAYRAGIQAIGRLLEVDSDDRFPKSLLIEALKRAPEEFLFVDTVARAAAWEIDVFGLKPPLPLMRPMLEKACLNSARSNKNKWSGRWWEASGSPTGQNEKITAPNQPVRWQNKRYREVFDKFGGEGTYICVVDAYDTPRGLRIDVNFGASLKDDNIPKPASLKDIEKSDLAGNTPLFYLYDYTTRLNSLGN